MSLLLAALALSAPVALEQIVSREHPSFRQASARLTVGRDGLVYLASGGNNSYVLRVGRDGKGRFGGAVVYAMHNATASKDGTVATANAHFAHKVTLYDRQLKQTAALDDFLNNDAVGWSAPAHVEAGASGDFYGLDHARDRIVRFDARGKQLKAYAIPRRPEKTGQAWSFRVCEKTESFYVMPYNGPPYRVGFDGEVKWLLGPKMGPAVRFGHEGNAGGLDVAEDGTLHLIGQHSDEVHRLTPEGKPAGTVKLRGGPAIAKSGGPGSVSELRVFGDDLVMRVRDATELFRVYDRKTGQFRRAVHAQAERLRVRLEGRTWEAGGKAGLKVELDPKTVRAPAWRVWLRSLDEADDRELAWKGGAVQVPEGLGGLYLLRVSPEVRPWSGGTPPEYLVRTWVNVRQPKTRGTLSIWTGRTRFARGEVVPVTVLLRAKGETKAEKVTLKLIDVERKATVAQKAIAVKPNVACTKASIGCTAELAPGRYLLTADAPGRTVAPQPLVIGPGRPEGQRTHLIQYGDYGATYPEADAWDLPAVSASHVERARKVGLTMFVDRVGFPTMAGATRPARRPAEMDELLKALAADPDGVAPEKAGAPLVMGPTMAGYSAEGMRQMAILMGNDAGLPLGTGFDNRKPEQLLAEIDRVTAALKPYPAFRGWSWSSNWWVFHERGANAAKSPEEKKAYEAALAEAKKSGKWSEVLGRVAARRLGYARDAQALFNARLAKHGKFTTASAAPYRNVEAYPPISLSNVDEVDLQAQWEQIAVPYAAAHGVDFYRRPGKPAWMHPEVWNDSGTGDQVVPTLFMGLMRGADGVGFSGQLPPWAPRPRDSRNAHPGIVSMWRAVGNVVRTYGPWLRTLKNNDRVAIVVSGRMLKIDEWPNVYGTHFARLFEAYSACLHAHHPASYVFAEDLKPGALEKYKAVLVIDQRVEFEPELLKALQAAKKAGVKVFHDGTSRPELVKEFSPLGVSFTHFEKDPSPASDDAAYERFPKYVLASVPALRKALDPVAARVAKTDEAEFLMSERVNGKGRFVFVVNNTTMPHGPGKMWRQNLLVATRRPVKAKVDLGPDAKHVYDVFAMTKVGEKGIVEADCRDLHARLFAVLPARIKLVEIEVPEKVAAGQSFRCRVRILDDKHQPIDAAIPVRVRLLGPDGEVRFLSVPAKGGEVTFTVPRQFARDAITVEATELFGRLPQIAKVPVDRRKPAPGFAPAGATTAVPARKVVNSLEWLIDPSGPGAEGLFGQHMRDVAISPDGKEVWATSFNWGVNLTHLRGFKGTGRLAADWSDYQRRVGQGFAFSPQALNAGVAVQGFDFGSSEGYHLYLFDKSGRCERRFALYDTPGRLPHRFVPGILGGRLNQFAVAPDGSWVASAGNLGLVVWSSDGKERWRQDWWKSGEPSGLLHTLNAESLVLVRGVEAAAFSAKDGKELWRLRLAPSGETKCIRAGDAGRAVAFLTDADGGRVFLLRDGKLLCAVPCLGDDMALSSDASTFAVVEGRQLKYYRDGTFAWSMPADDMLHHPRLSKDGKAVACCSEAGALYLLGPTGEPLFRENLGAIAVPAFLPDGDVLAVGWMGRLTRLTKAEKGTGYRVLGTAHRRSRGGYADLLEKNATPTSRVSAWGNALPKPLPLTDNLLGPKTVRIEFKSSMHHAPLVGNPEVLVDGKADPPAEPWLGWPTVGWFAEAKTFNALQFDTFRRRLRVEAVTLVEDARHPESWLRDCRLEYWDAAKERWVLATRLLSDAATHSHRLEKPAEASRWRLVPSHLSGNLRLAEVVFHGKDLGPSHPDVVAMRPVAVLFDEGDELREAGLVSPTWGLSFVFGGAHSGGRYLRMEAGRSVAPVWKPPFGHVLPDWDFEVAEKPGPGQYRYLQFACKGLSEKTTGLVLRLDGEAYGRSISCYAGDYKKEADALGHKVADAPPRDWTVYTVDLWEAFKKPVRIRGMRLAATGGPAGFDRVLLGRSRAAFGKE